MRPVEVINFLLIDKPESKVIWRCRESLFYLVSHIVISFHSLLSLTLPSYYKYTLWCLSVRVEMLSSLNWKITTHEKPLFFPSFLLTFTISHSKKNVPQKKLCVWERFIQIHGSQWEKSFMQGEFENLFIARSFNFIF